MRWDEAKRDAWRAVRRGEARGTLGGKQSGKRGGTGDEPMRWGVADEMNEPHGAEGGWRRSAADEAGKQRAKRMSR